MVVDVLDADFCSAEPRPLFEGLEPQRWAVSPDGQTFVALAPRPAPRLKLIQGLDALLESVTGDR